MRWLLVIRAIVHANARIGLDLGGSVELGVALLCRTAADAAASSRHFRATKDASLPSEE